MVALAEMDNSSNFLYSMQKAYLKKFTRKYARLISTNTELGYVGSRPKSVFCPPRSLLARCLRRHRIILFHSPAINPTLVLDELAVLPAPPDYSFAVRRSPELPAYQELVLEDARGHDAHWVISQPLRQLAKRPVLL